MYCTKCGRKNPDKNKYCVGCGSELKRSQGQIEKSPSQNNFSPTTNNPESTLSDNKKEHSILNTGDNNSNLVSTQVPNIQESHSNEIAPYSPDKLEPATQKLHTSYHPNQYYEKDNSISPSLEVTQKNNKGLIIGFFILLILCAGGIFVWFYYENVYLPEKIDREAPRTYPMVNLFLHSSKMEGGEFNKITTVPASAELITYEDDGHWAKVKYIPSRENVKPMEGYVASDYLLNKKDLYLMTSMLADNEVREILATSKVRRGLINYFNQEGIAGKISAENAQEVGLPYSPSNQWQVIFHKGQAKPNEVLFKRAYRSDSKFTDMAVIIENVTTGEKKILYFTYDDDETPHLRGASNYRYDNILDYIISGNILYVYDQNRNITSVPLY